MEKMCDERHKRIDERFKTQDKINENCEIRLTDLEKSDAAMSEKLSGLISQLGSLNTILKWFIGLFATSLLGFFMYAVQKGLIG